MEILTFCRFSYSNSLPKPLKAHGLLPALFLTLRSVKQNIQAATKHHHGQFKLERETKNVGRRARRTNAANLQELEAEAEADKESDENEIKRFLTEIRTIEEEIAEEMAAAAMKCSAPPAPAAVQILTSPSAPTRPNPEDSSSMETSVGDGCTLASDVSTTIPATPCSAKEKRKKAEMDRLSTATKKRVVLKQMESSARAGERDAYVFQLGVDRDNLKKQERALKKLEKAFKNDQKNNSLRLKYVAMSSRTETLKKTLQRAEKKLQLFEYDARVAQARAETAREDAIAHQNIVKHFNEAASQRHLMMSNKKNNA